MKPELRRRLIGSIEYLRKMGFFQDYSSLSSEEMLEKIFDEETCYENAWWTGREITGHLEKLHGQSARAPNWSGILPWHKKML
jgi:hypothetical protein